MESIIANEILNFLYEHKLINEHQHGFLKRHSTSTNLLECMNDWTISLANYKSVSIAYIDFKSAFDLISHFKLLVKLSGYGISVCLYFWIKAFLSGRQQELELILFYHQLVLSPVAFLKAVSLDLYFSIYS